MEEENKETLAETIHEIQEEQEKEEVKEEVVEEKTETPVTTEEKKEEVVPVTNKEPEKKSKKIPIIIISSIVLLLIVLAVVLMLVLGGKKKYTVTFDTAGGNRIESVKVEKGSTVNKPVDPTKEGYVFKGWEYEGSPYYFNTEVTKNITIKATWEVDTTPKEGDRIKVTFVYNNGDSDKVVEVLYNTKLKEPDDPVYEGYEFDGWYKDNNEYYFGDEVTEPFTLEAKWEKAKDNEYVINFNTGGGTRVESQTVKKGNKVVEPKDPTKEGYTFVEWQLNGNKYDFSKEVTSNLTLEAKWNTKKEELTCTKETTDDDGTKMTLEMKFVSEANKITSVLSSYIFTTKEDADKYCTNFKNSKPELIDCTDTKVTIKDIDEFSKADGVEKIVGMTKTDFETKLKTDGYTCK